MIGKVGGGHGGGHGGHASHGRRYSQGYGGAWGGGDTVIVDDGADSEDVIVLRMPDGRTMTLPVRAAREAGLLGALGSTAAVGAQPAACACVPWWAWLVTGVAVVSVGTSAVLGAKYMRAKRR